MGGVSWEWAWWALVMRGDFGLLVGCYRAVAVAVTVAVAVVLACVLVDLCDLV